MITISNIFKTRLFQSLITRNFLRGSANRRTPPSVIATTLMPETTAPKRISRPTVSTASRRKYLTRTTTKSLESQGEIQIICYFAHEEVQSTYKWLNQLFLKCMGCALIKISKHKYLSWNKNIELLLWYFIDIAIRFYRFVYQNMPASTFN